MGMKDIGSCVAEWRTWLAVQTACSPCGRRNCAHHQLDGLFMPLDKGQLVMVVLPQKCNLQQTRANGGQDSLPEFVALTVSQHEVRQFFQDGLSRHIHQVERAPVIGLLELVLGRESGVANISAHVG